MLINPKKCNAGAMSLDAYFRVISSMAQLTLMAFAKHKYYEKLNAGIEHP